MNKVVTVSFVALLLPIGSACSMTIDRNLVQCTRDADCVQFENDEVVRAVCVNSVCVDSGLGPRGCFAGTPTTETEYLNACTTAHYRKFDNCERLGICDGLLPEAMQPPASKIASSTVNPVPVPAVRCADAGPNIIYMAGAADFQPLLKAVTPMLSANNPPYRAVFQNADSCRGVNSVFDPAQMLIKDVPGSSTKAANYAFYIDDSGNRVNCLLDPAGNKVDIGVSDLYSTTCSPDFVPNEAIAGYTGPVVSFTFIAPAASKEDVISAEAAHIVFGLGGQNPLGKTADPWINPTYYFIRNPGAAVTALTAEMIGVPKSQFWGVDRLSTDNLRDSMQASAVIDPAIGMVSIDYAEKARGNLKELYLQGVGQSAGYLPDSTATGFDKQNVRDGHYSLWGYVHFYTAIDGTGVPSPAAGAFVTRFTLPRLDQSLLDAMIAASLVPQCAMKVARTVEFGPRIPNPSSFECGCYFDLRATGKTTCLPCASSADCPATTPACNYGFCEKK